MSATGRAIVLLACALCALGCEEAGRPKWRQKAPAVRPLPIETWRKGGKLLKERPIVDCDAVPEPVTGPAFARVRFEQVVTDGGQTGCAHFLLTIANYDDFLPIVEKELGRVPGCERCDVVDVHHFVGRDMVLRVRYGPVWEGRLRGGLDSRDQPGRAGPYTVAWVSFEFRRPRDPTPRFGVLDFRCPDTDRAARECRSFREATHPYALYPPYPPE